MKRVGRAGLEFPVEVPTPGGFVLRVYQQCANSDDLCSLPSAKQCVLQEGCTKSDTLVLLVHGEACEDHHWNRVPRYPFDHARRRVVWLHTSYGEAVETGDQARVTAHVGLSTIGPLAVQGMALQELVQCGLAAIEGLD